MPTLSYELQTKFQCTDKVEYKVERVLIICVRLSNTVFSFSLAHNFYFPFLSLKAWLVL